MWRDSHHPMSFRSPVRAADSLREVRKDRQTDRQIEEEPTNAASRSHAQNWPCDHAVKIEEKVNREEKYIRHTARESVFSMPYKSLVTDRSPCRHSRKKTKCVPGRKVDRYWRGQELSFVKLERSGDSVRSEEEVKHTHRVMRWGRGHSYGPLLSFSRKATRNTTVWACDGIIHLQGIRQPRDLRYRNTTVVVTGGFLMQ